MEEDDDYVFQYLTEMDILNRSTIVQILLGSLPLAVYPLWGPIRIPIVGALGAQMGALLGAQSKTQESAQ